MRVIQIQWSAPSKEEARKICKDLVLQKLVACANIIPDVESIYFWEEEVETSLEAKVMLKTTEEKLQNVIDYILKNGSYQLPEITKSGFLEGYAPYLSWVSESVL